MPTRIAAAALLFAVAATPARAELPPGVYDKMRADAGEAVILQVTSVKVTDGPVERAVTVEAKVLAVETSKSGLKTGETVTLKYTIPNESKPGPSPVPLLEKGAVAPAFLNKKGDVFVLAAGGHSFTMTPFSRN